jgi:Na+/H+ antiporter NhaC
MIFRTMGYAIENLFCLWGAGGVFEKTAVANLLAEPLCSKSLCQNPVKNVFKATEAERVLRLPTH